MRKMDLSKVATCGWALRFEVLGIILLAIATCLTIATHNGLGIVALFAAGIILCIFNKFCCYAYPTKNTSCPICDMPHAETSINKPASTKINKTTAHKKSHPANKG